MAVTATSSPLAQLDPSTLVLSSIVIVLLAIFYVNRTKVPKGSKLPPGPKGLPIVGNLPDIPAERPWVKLAEWGKEYGPIFRIKLGLQNVVVLSSAEAAWDLLEKRSSIYSSRPRAVMAEEIVSKGLRLTFMPYHELWKKERKLLYNLTSPKASASYEPLQELESTQLMRDMLERPQAFWGHLQRYAGSFIMQVSFNKRAKTFSDPDVTDMRNVLKDLTRVAVPGTYLVDSLPFLNYLPSFLAPWKSEGERIHQFQRKLFMRHFKDVEQAIKEGKDAHCLTRYALESKKEYNLSDVEIAFLSGVMYGAGSDTTADGLCTFVLSMVLHPQVVKKAQEELDRVVGKSRLPDFNDQEDLVYIGAVVREVQRWRPIIAGGLGHATTEDDVYEGYFIPKGTTVIPNAWAIHMDPNLYPEPEKFNPERFIEKGKLVGVPHAERGHFGFGYGRRNCPGAYMAERSLFIVISRMLWGLKITNAKDEQGNIIQVDPNAYTAGFSSHPKPFKCDIQPRGDYVQKVVDEVATALNL